MWLEWLPNLKFLVWDDVVSCSDFLFGIFDMCFIRQCSVQCDANIGYTWSIILVRAVRVLWPRCSPRGAFLRKLGLCLGWKGQRICCVTRGREGGREGEGGGEGRGGEGGREGERGGEGRRGEGRGEEGGREGGER